MAKKLIAIAMFAALCLWAADFWVAKPYTDWNEKEIQKMLNDSPWANKASIEVGGPGGAGAAKGGGFGGPGGGGGGGGKGGGRGAGGPQGDASNSDPGIDGGGGGGFGGGGMSAPVLIRWQALPVKQALLKQKYGNEVGTSADAKKILEREEPYYIIYVATAQTAVRGIQARKDALLMSSSLNIKGKEAIRPADIQFAGSPQSPTIEMYFLFPKTAAITMEDKEVEFATKLNSSNLKSKFKLKELTLNNKLEL